MLTGLLRSLARLAFRDLGRSALASVAPASLRVPCFACRPARSIHRNRRHLGESIAGGNCPRGEQHRGERPNREAANIATAPAESARLHFDFDSFYVLFYICLLLFICLSFTSVDRAIFVRARLLQ